MVIRSCLSCWRAAKISASAPGSIALVGETQHRPERQDLLRRAAQERANSCTTPTLGLLVAGRSLSARISTINKFQSRTEIHQNRHSGNKGLNQIVSARERADQEPNSSYYSD